MNKLSLTILFSFSITFLVFAHDPAQNIEKANQLLNTQGNAGFIENKGQMSDINGNPVPFVLFKTEAPDLNFWITEKGITIQTIQWRKVEKDQKELNDFEIEDEKRTGKKKTKKFIDWEIIDIELKGAKISKESVIKENPTQGHFNFFYPHCPDGIYEVKEYQKIIIQNVYEGIDWVFYRKPGGALKYDFIVHAGANYKQIQLLYKTLNPLALNAKGQLEIKTQYGTVLENTPISFYEQKEVATSFSLLNLQKRTSENNALSYETLVTFNLDLPETHLPSQLIIDPELVWATFYGGNGSDGPMNIKIDNSNNLYIVGYLIDSYNFPLQDNGLYFQGTFLGTTDGFILKFNSEGKRLWATFYGGNENDSFEEIAIGNNDQLFIIGNSGSSDFPIQDDGGYFQPLISGNIDFVVLKFTTNGERLWGSFFGGNEFEWNVSMVIDGDDNIWLTGSTFSSNFPVHDMGGYFQPNNIGQRDIFLSKFSSAGVLLWSTYFGGTNSDYAYSIAIDKQKNIYITGYTNSTNFTVKNFGNFNFDVNNGKEDVILIKFSEKGELIWSSYYGGSSGEIGLSIKVSDLNEIFLVGKSLSDDLYLKNAGTFYQSQRIGKSEMFIVKIDSEGNIIWGTYFGGEENEAIYGPIKDNLVFDSCGNFYIAFDTESKNIFTKSHCDNGYQDETHNEGQTDLFLASFSSNGDFLWGSYFGGNGRDFRPLFVVDNDNNLFMTGEWSSYPSFNVDPSSYPLKSNGQAYFDDSHNGNDDIFIAKFNLSNLEIYSDSIIRENNTAEITANGGCLPYTYLWSDGQTTHTAINLSHSTTYTVEVIDAAFCKKTAKVIPRISSIIVPNVFTPNNDGLNDAFRVTHENIVEYKINILNRWEHVVYESSNIEERWDGNYNGKECSEGTYFYFITAKGLDGEIYNYKGSLSLFRGK